MRGCVPRSPLRRAKATGLTPPLVSLARGRLIILVACQQCPHNAGIFVGNCHRCSVEPAPCDQPPYPTTASIRFITDPTHHGPCPMHEEFAQIPVPPFTDPQQPLLAARRMLAWH